MDATDERYVVTYASWEAQEIATLAGLMIGANLVFRSTGTTTTTTTTICNCNDEESAMRAYSKLSSSNNNAYEFLSIIHRLPPADLKSVGNALKSEYRKKVDGEIGNWTEEVVSYIQKVGLKMIAGGVATCAAGKFCGGLQNVTTERVDATLSVGPLLAVCGMALHKKAPRFSAAMVTLGVLAIALAVVTTKAMPLSHADTTVIVLFSAVFYRLF